MEKYKTVANSCEIKITEKKSEFIATIFPAKNTEEINKFLCNIRKTHKKARHNCYGYILLNANNNPDQITEKYNDDGEPSGTAGMPILEVLRSNKLFDVGCIVTRYFGGILLGAGGLTRAYSTAAAMAVKNAYIVTKSLAITLEIEAEYTYYNRIKAALTQFCGRSLKETFAELTTVTAIVPCKTADDFSKHLIDICNGGVKITNKQKLYYNF